MNRSFLKISRNNMGLILVFCLVYPFFFWGESGGESSRLFSEVWNLGHFFFFSVFIIFFDGSLRGWISSCKIRFVLAVLVLFFMGLAIELGQLHIGGRYFSWNDLVKDILGGCCALFVLFSLSVTGIWTVIFRIIAMILLVIAFVPLGVNVYDQYRMYSDFPLMAGFERRSELSRWQGNASLARDSSVFRSGAFSGKIVLTDDKYSGVSLRYFPGNWSGYDGLAFSIYNPGEPVLLSCRVHDDLHKENPVYSNRYHGNITLRKGWNDITIPMVDIINGPENRLMDITKIRGFGLFVTDRKKGRHLYLDDVRLLRELEKTKKQQKGQT